MPIQRLVYYKLNVIKTLMSFVNINIESFEILGKDIEKKLGNRRFFERDKRIKTL